MSTGYLTRSQYHYECTVYDDNIKTEADVYSSKTPKRMTMNNPDGHREKHGLGNNPGKYVNEQEYDMIFVMRPY